MARLAIAVLIIETANEVQNLREAVTNGNKISRGRRPKPNGSARVGVSTATASVHVAFVAPNSTRSVVSAANKARTS